MDPYDDGGLACYWSVWFLVVVTALSMKWHQVEVNETLHKAKITQRCCRYCWDLPDHAESFGNVFAN